jgi:glucose/arabinose dehydrogenase
VLFCGSRSATNGGRFFFVQTVHHLVRDVMNPSLRSLMSILLWLITALLLSSVRMIAQPVSGAQPWTPVVRENLRPVRVHIPQALSGRGLNADAMPLNLPEGWTASVFYAGTELAKGRFMAWGPDSVLYIASMNRGTVLALPDVDKDGVADRAIVAASGFVNGHDVRFWRDTMFVATENGLFTLLDSDGDMVFETRSLRIDKRVQPNQTGGGHVTRTVVIDSLQSRLYYSVGSRGNAERELNRAVIEVYDIDGGNRRIYATGVRNAVGMTLHPRTGKLWANNNGSDRAGNDIPGEWVDIVREGGFYGYPFAHHHQVFFDFNLEDYRNIRPITAADTAALLLMQPPAALLAAHSAPMALEFAHPAMPDPYNRGAFCVMRGSWNRRPASGSKLVWLEFDDVNDTVANAVHDFCTGFMVDSNAQPSARRWGRPVGLALAADGSIYLSSDDITHVILKLTPPKSPSVVRPTFNTSSLSMSPHPVVSTARLSWPDAPAIQSYSIVDVRGSVLLKGALQDDALTSGVTLDCSPIPAGSYVLSLMCADGRVVDLPLVVAR